MIQVDKMAKMAIMAKMPKMANRLDSNYARMRILNQVE